MRSLGIPIMDPGSESASSTVPELVSELRSSFLSAEFQNITAKLMEHEKVMKLKLDELKNKAETVMKENDLLLSENLKLNEELKKNKKMLDSMRNANIEYKDQINEFNLQKSRVSKNLELEEELKKKQDEIDSLKKVNAKCEKLIRVYKTRFSDLDDRIILLEETAKELKGSAIDFKKKELIKTCVAESSIPKLSSEKVDSNKRTEPEFQKINQIIEIDDDDQCISPLKRKRVPNEIKKEDTSNDNDLECISILKTKRVETEIKKEFNQQNESKNLSCSSNIEQCDEKLKSESAKLKKPKERWESEDDMVLEFEKNDELCLNAVCALHRQKVYVGFNVSRIASLATLLIDRDPQKKLKKKASELNDFDLKQCRMFAKDYSFKLFEIYQKKKDPFFPFS